MLFEYRALVAACILGCVHLASASFAFKRQVGHEYTIGARDEKLMPEGLAGRLYRAHRNFLETFSIFVGLMLVLDHVQGFDRLSWWGSLLYICGRIAFLPLYAAGVRLYRTLAWKIATTGLALMGVSIFA